MTSKDQKRLGFAYQKPPAETEELLQDAIMRAHEAGEKSALAELYCQAGEREEAKGATDAACFFYTYAYVFGLEAGSPLAAELLCKLLAFGRDEA